MANKAVGTGENAINSFDPTATANSQKSSLGSSGLGGLLGGETNDITSKYQSAVANNPTVQNLYQQGQNLYNVPNLAKTANYYQNAVTNALPDAYQGAKGYDIDNTDIQNGVASKLAYLEPQSAAATNNYNTASGLAQGFMNAGIQQNQMNLMPVQNEAQLVSQMEAGQATGWNQASANELQALISKMQSGVELSKTEMDRANQLSQQEEAYQQAVAQANIQAAGQVQATQEGQKYQILKPGDELINTFKSSNNVTKNH